MQAVFVARAIKKFLRLFRAHPAVLLVLALTIALPQVSRAQTNYNRIALQRWYAGNTAAAFSVGSYPTAVAFDGASIWVGNDNVTGTVTKINVSDGTTTLTFNLGTPITQLAFDGSNPAIDTDHLLKALLAEDDSLVEFLLKRNDVNIAFVTSKLDESLQKLPKVSGGQPAQTMLQNPNRF